MYNWEFFVFFLEKLHFLFKKNVFFCFFGQKKIPNLWNFNEIPRKSAMFGMYPYVAQMKKALKNKKNALK